MKTSLPSSPNKTAKAAIVGKLLLIIFVSLLCFGNRLYADIKPAIKHNNKTIGNADRGIKKAVYNPSKRSVAFAPPIISYSGGAQSYHVGTAISILTPTSSGVAASGFAAPVNIGSGLSGPRGVAIDAAGNVFVADYLNGQVKKIPVGGGAPVIWGSGFSQPIAVATDAAGAVYVADLGSSFIKKIPAGGGAPVPIGAGFTNPVAIAADPAGNVYVADSNVLWKIPVGGAPVSVLSTFAGLIGIALDSFGTIYAGDLIDKRIYKIPQNGEAPTILASNTNSPLGIVLDGEGNLFWTDDTNYVLNEIPANGGAPVTISSFTNVLTGLGIGTDGTLYVGDYYANVVKKISPSGGYHISPGLPLGLTFDGATGAISGTPMASLPATNFTITAYNSSGSTSVTLNIKVSALDIAYNGPVTLTTATTISPLAPISSGVATAGYSTNAVDIGSGFAARGTARDAAGNIYVADFNANVVRKIPANGGAITVIGSGFSGPVAVAVDVSGNVYVADYGHDAVKMIPFGGGAPVTLGSGFKQPRGVAVDGAGNVFVVDAGNHAMKEIPVGGGTVINLGTFTAPLGVTTDASGNVYFSESSNGVVYKLPVIGGAPFIVASGLTSPTSLAVDATGNIFIADIGAGAILELSLNTNNLTAVGPALSAPAGIVIDGAGVLYASERNGSSIKKIVPTGGYYINFLPAGLNFDNSTGVISGTPTTASSALFYMVTGYNSYGSNSATFSIQVNLLPLPSVNYSVVTKPFAVNYPIVPLAPQSTGVAAPGYSNAPYTLRSGFNNPVGIAVDASGSVTIAVAGLTSLKKFSPGNPNIFTLGSGFNYPSAVAIDGSGNTYVADQLNNAIKKVNNSNITSTVATGFNNPTGVAVDVLGNIYVADKGNNAVKKIPTGGGAAITIGSGFSLPTGVAVDSFGNVYVADAGNNAIKMIPAAGGGPVSLGTGFNQPTAIALDASGNIYVADTGNDAVKKMPAGGGDPEVISLAIVHPLGIAVDFKGFVYVTDNLNGSIKTISPVGGYYVDKPFPAGIILDNATGMISGTALAAKAYSSYHVTGYNNTGGGTATLSFQVDLFPAPEISYATPQSFVINTAVTPVTPASTNVSVVAYSSSPVSIGAGFNLPDGVAVDGAGNVYVADTGNGTVEEIRNSDGATFSIGSGFNNPAGIAVDGAGNVFVADNGNNKIYKIPVGGGATTALGGNGFINPVALAVDSAGNVFVADNGANSLKKVPADGSATVTVLGGFNSITGVAVDVSGNLFVVDAGNNVVKMIPVDGSSAFAIGSGFNQPVSVAVDAAGNVYVGDSNNSAVKMIPATGGAIMSLGSGFNHTYGVAVDASGNVYVCDYLNNAIKKIIPVGGYFIGPGLPAGLKFDNNTGVISGTPTAGSPATNYTVTGYNVSAGNSAQLNIKVNLIPPPVVSYGAAKTYITNIAVTPLSPVVTGVAAPGFSNTPFSFITGGQPISVTTDAAGNIYYADRFTNTIKKLPVNSNVPVVIGTGLDQIAGIAVDAAGNVYAGGYNTPVITKIPAGGGAQVTAGSGFSSPSGIAIDASGNIFVADQSKNAIYKIPVGGGAPVLIAINLNGAYGVAVDGAGNVYFSSTGNSNVRKVPADGSPIVVVASGLNTPYGVAVDNFGNVFVAENGTKSIKEIPAGGGAIITVASGLGSPTDVSVDAAGNLFVADFSAGAIKKISRSGGYYVNPLLPAGLSIDVATGIISGTPTQVSATKNFNLFAYNSSGAGKATISITITVPPAPNISYTTPNIFILGTAIPTLSPVNTGGAVPATVYSAVSTFAGSGVSGSANGTGLAATFNGPTGLATDAAGNVYVANYVGNTIRKITPGGVTSTLAGSGSAGSANGTGIAASFKNPFGIILDAAGNVYVGDAGNNRIRKITPAGVVTTFAGSGVAGSANGTGTAATFSTPRGLALDAAGNVYVADYTNNLIRKITPAGVVSTFAGSGVAGNVNGTGTAASFSGPTALTIDAAGNIYVADYANSRIRKITSGAVVTTFAGSTAGLLDGTGIAAKFKNPFGVFADNAGNIYVADHGNNVLRKITPAGVVTTIAGDGTAGSVNGTGAAAEFKGPRGLTSDGAGNMYVADYAGHQVRKVLLTGYTISPVLPAGLNFSSTTGAITGTPTTYSPATDYTISAYNNTGSDVTTINIAVTDLPNISYTTPQTYIAGTVIAALAPVNTGAAVPATVYSAVSTFAGSGVSGSANGTGLAATFNGPTGLATDAAGNVYVANYVGNTIRKITPGGVTSTLAGSGSAGSANGTGIAASFKNPFGIILDAAGNVYVGDAGNNRIRKITPAGVVTTFAGSGVAGSANGTGTAATFSTPRGLALDAAGNVYVADYTNNLIRKITPAGVVSTFAGSGVAGNVNGTGTAASFSGPTALTIDAAGNIYVADYANSRIRKITSGAVVTTFAGSTAGLLDGTGIAAKFKNPFGVFADNAGNIYVADHGNNVLRKITPAGVVTTIAGDGTAGSVNGTGAAAEFKGPRGLTSDGAGNMYVADYAGHQVRKVLLTGYTISPALPAGLSLNSATGVITGTPAAANSATDYTVTAYNTAGGDAATVNITILPAVVPLPNISYTTPQTYTAGTAIPTLSPVNTGGAVPATVYSAVSTFAGSGVSGSANGTGLAATFNGPTGLATDAAGNVYVANYVGNTIRKITPGGVTSTLAGSGSAGSANGTGIAASFKNPFGIILDAAGNVYVGDAGNNRIRKITPAGVVTTFAGSGVAGSATGTGTAATFSTPRGLALDAAGNVYVADYTNNLIRKITPAGVVSTFAGSGVAGNVNGTGTAASFSGPTALTIDAAGNIYVADYANSRIRKITSGAVVTTFAGSTAGLLDGTGIAAKFKNPFGVFADNAGNIYVADHGNNVLRKITPAGVVTTIAGDGTAGSVNGTGAAAEFKGPRGLTSDGAGNMYVADYAGHQVRKVLLTGYTISPALPAGLSFNSTTGVISGTPTAAQAAATYTITAYNAAGSDAATINITIKAMGSMVLAQPAVPFDAPVTADAPVVKQGLSPNGDGKNDVLVIDNIERYPDNKLIIMNSVGSTVYQASGYDNANKVFDGHASNNGTMQKPGTYFYRLEYKDKGTVKYKTGYILIKY